MAKRDELNIEIEGNEYALITETNSDGSGISWLMMVPQNVPDGIIASGCHIFPQDDWRNHFDLYIGNQKIKTEKDYGSQNYPIKSDGESYWINPDWIPTNNDFVGL
jgi:hypothetical protein